MNTTNLTPKHLLLALVIVVIWGTNFIAIYVGLKELPPFLFSAIRFGLSALPFVFFIPRPKTPWKYLFGFGIFNFVLQFGLLFTGMHLGLSPGLASLVVQVQVFFSMGLAFLLFSEKPGIIKIIGSVISFAGIGIVALNVNGSATLIGFIFAILAALSWAFGNVFTKKINAKSPFALVAWGNLIALPFMLAISFFMEGPAEISNALSNISWNTIGAVAFVVYLSTHLGYGLWGYLLKTYPTSTVVPYTLLIPVVGFLSSAVFLGENLDSWKLWASLFIMSGLVFSLFEKKIRKWLGNLKANLKVKNQYRNANKRI